MSDPTVAVIVPTYNRASVICEAVDSLLAQVAAPEEIIVVDDGSTDGTTDVLARYGEAIRVIRQENGGAAAARNTGAMAARADWLTFLDSDDVWLPGRMTFLRDDLAGAAPDIVAHVANVRFRGVGEGQDFFGVMRLPVTAGERREVARPLTMFLHAAFLIGMAFRRDVFVAEGGFDVGFPTDEDTEMVHRMAAHGRFLVRGDAVADVIRRPGDTSALSALRRKDPALAIELKLRQFRAILARSDDPTDRRLAGQALCDGLLQRADLIRRTGAAGYWATLAEAARSHPTVWKGWTKAAGSMAFGRRAGTALDRTA